MKVYLIIMGKANDKVDSWFVKIQKYVTEKIGSFVAFLFVLYALGAMTAIMVSSIHPDLAYLVVIAPAIAGIIAYYNRAFATFCFGIIILFVFLI